MVLILGTDVATGKLLFLLRLIACRDCEVLARMLLLLLLLLCDDICDDICDDTCDGICDGIGEVRRRKRVSWVSVVRSVRVFMLTLTSWVSAIKNYKNRER